MALIDVDRAKHLPCRSRWKCRLAPLLPRNLAPFQRTVAHCCWYEVYDERNDITTSGRWQSSGRPCPFFVNYLTYQKESVKSG